MASISAVPALEEQCRKIAKKIDEIRRQAVLTTDAFTGDANSFKHLKEEIMWSLEQKRNTFYMMSRALKATAEEVQTRMDELAGVKGPLEVKDSKDLKSHSMYGISLDDGPKRYKRILDSFIQVDNDTRKVVESFSMWLKNLQHIFIGPNTNDNTLQSNVNLPEHDDSAIESKFSMASS